MITITIMSDDMTLGQATAILAGVLQQSDNGKYHIIGSITVDTTEEDEPNTETNKNS